MTNHNAPLKEGGQATLSALIELVAMLEQDANTDWANVNIDGFHSHLLDMNHLVLDTNAAASVIDDNKIRFDIRGSAASIPSIHRMVPAHSQLIEQSRGWTIAHELDDRGATLTISNIDEAQTMRIKALGFYGFMSLDSHHQSHHYQMAIGNSH